MAPPCLWGFVSCSVVSSCGSRPLWVLCSVHCLVSLALGWVRFWPAVSTAPVRCEVCRLGCPSWLVLLLRSLFVLHLLLRWGGLVTGLWPLLLLLCVGLLWGLCCAILSPWALARPTLQGLRLRIPMFSWSKLLEFSWTLYWGYFLSLPVVTDSSGWLLVHPDSPPSVAWRRELLPWCSVGGMSACPSGAAVLLGSSVLRSSWSSRWEHLSQVGPVVFLSPRS